MFFADTLYGSYELAVLVKLVLAAIAGGVVGLEREKHGRPAGLRTHLLVALGACLMMIVSEAFQLKYAAFDTTSAVRLDPGRTAAQIITGIGFLGAGVIIKEGITVRGLTTAASLWLVAGLGMAFGMGLFLPGAMATVLALMSLIFLKMLEPIINKDRYLDIAVTANNRPGLQDELEKLFVERRLRITDVRSHVDLQHDEIILEYVLTQHRRRMGRELTDMVAGLEGVHKVRYH
ncbi:MAG: MgtC/SapB family protein [Desulfuromonadales bacterium]|nr:MgtC/SapB family protein [Desulfuromonadales bacterium]